MTDRPLFNLDAEARWQLAYDQHQWIIQYREAKKTYRLGAKGKNSGWRDRSYVNGKKETLWRLFREPDILLSDEAVQRVDSMPETFCHFLLQHDPETARRNPCVKGAMLEKPPHPHWRTADSFTRRKSTFAKELATEGLADPLVR